MKTLGALSLTGLLLSSTSVALQNTPDFSGVWMPVTNHDTAPVLERRPGSPPPPPKTLSVTITQSPSEMRVDRRLQMSDQDTTNTFLYNFDGTQTVNRMGPLVFHTTATWEDDALVLTSDVSADGNHIGHLREVYRLENDQLVVEGVRTAPAGTFAAKTVHRRAQ